MDLKYYEDHKCCPNCFNKEHSTTCVSYLEGIDKNLVTCANCSWKGIVHDLVKEPKKK
jgi:hypothetical protein